MHWHLVMMVAYENGDCSMEATRHFPLRLHVVHHLTNSYTQRFSFPEKMHAHICTLVVAQQPAGLLIHLVSLTTLLSMPVSKSV